MMDAGEERKKILVEMDRAWSAGNYSLLAALSKLLADHARKRYKDLLAAEKAETHET